ncbi:hypothetical protein C5167_000767 [Papaver somniferum]|uniref:phosphogluconate dehydrogenase (NADP(+)-dependent, decarboxylating) n=1 Tax=Papaver somniferum TaxID=3469 RepID=A0A4Y7KUV3_PAPSO|nr:hypothetical protein C5167_000767 [Papaver somniferum]
MGVSGGEEGARNGPSMMPGGSLTAYKNIEEIVKKVAAQVEDGPCVTYIGEGGSGNFVKMVHNGIEYGDMQLISEAYDVLKNVCGLRNDELARIFEEWNNGELERELVDKILDKTGMKGTGKWTVQQAAELSVAAPTIAAWLDCRYLSGLKEERNNAEAILKEAGMVDQVGPVRSGIDKKRLIDDVRQGLYASKICSHAQGMNLLRAKSNEKGWGLDLGEMARIWKGGCIIRAVFLDRIKQAYQRNPQLASLVVDPEFAKEMVQRQAAWRRVVGLAVQAGISTPGMCASLAYFDTYRRARLPANLVQAQRDLFGAHTYERIDCPGALHTEWTKLARQRLVKNQISLSSLMKMGDESFLEKFVINLEKRIIPRCVVIQFLVSKGQIKEQISLSSLFVPPDKLFLERHVSKHEVQVPELSKVKRVKYSKNDS